MRTTIEIPAERNPELRLPDLTVNTGLMHQRIGRIKRDEISLDAQLDNDSEGIAETRWAPVPVCGIAEIFSIGVVCGMALVMAYNLFFA